MLGGGDDLEEAEPEEKKEKAPATCKLDLL